MLTTETTQRREAMSWRRALATVGIIMVLAVVGVRLLVIDTVTVASNSMAPTVCSGDTVMLKRLSNPDAVQVNDIVTFRSPEDGQSAIKRVVAVAGQTVAIEDAELVVDGRRVSEPYVDHATIDGVYFGPVTVGEGQVFVMGDHREVSIDSRAYGAIPLSLINGKLLADFWSDCPAP